MNTILQAAISGILMGGVYAIIAVGLSLIFGVMRIVNFAHGEFLMAGMYACYALILFWSIDPYISLLIIAPAFFGIGYLFQKVILNRMLKHEKSREPLSILLFTAGFGMFLSNLALMLFGANPLSANSKYNGKTFEIGGLIVSEPRLYAFLISGVCTICLYLFLYKSETGRALRATSQNRDTAKLMGININRIYCIAFGLGIGLVSIASVVLVPFYYIFPTVGSVFSLRSFVIVVLGGMGSVPGALLGGLLIGIVEAIGGQFLTPSYAEILVFIIFLAVLLFKPSGLLSNEKS